MTDQRRPSPRIISEQETHGAQSNAVKSPQGSQSEQPAESQERESAERRASEKRLQTQQPLQSRERLQRLQSEEMALRNLSLTVSEYTRSDIEQLLQLVREEIDREREQMNERTEGDGECA